MSHPDGLPDLFLDRSLGPVRTSPRSNMAERYLRHLDAITEASTDPGPVIYAFHDRSIERLDLDR